MRSLILVFSIVVTAFAQFPNSSFENWTGTLPDSCWTNNSVVTPITQVTGGTKGTYALKGEVVSYLNVPYAPLLSMGGVQGFPFTSRPGNVEFYYQFSPQGGDKFEVSITLRTNNPLKIIAAGSEVSIADAASTFTKLTVPLEYFYSESPDVCMAQFMISNKDGEHIGSYFVLDEINFTGTATGVERNDASIPSFFELHQNYPNPFNPSTTIRYGLPFSSNVSLKIYNILGQQVANLVDSEQPAGWHEIPWDASVPSGVFFYRIDAVTVSGPDQQFSQIKKMLLMK